MKIERILTAALLIAAVMGCSKEQSAAEASDQVVGFSGATIYTRVAEGSSLWEQDDAIGIYMCLAGSTEFSSDEPKEFIVEPLSANDDAESFILSADFIEADGVEPYHYPNSYSEQLDFYAYYPYTLTLSEDHIAAIDLATEQVDLLLAEKLGATRSDGDIAFRFYHRMARLVLNISLNDNVSTLEGLTASISGLHNSASYDMLGGEATDFISNAAIALNVTEISSSRATAIALVHPETLGSDATVSFTVEGGDEFQAIFAAGTTYEQGAQYSYNISLGNDYIYFDEGDNEITLWGEEDGEDQFAEENGTSANPYLIMSAEDLQKIGSTEYDEWDEEECYRLMADIEVDLSDDSAEYYPIAQDGFEFNGMLDGNGYKIIYNEEHSCPLFYEVGENGVIKDLTIDTESVDELVITAADDNFGVITNKNYGGIKNVNIGSKIKISVTAWINYVGSIAGDNLGSIEGCTNEATVFSNGENEYIGGIVGFNNYSGTIMSCTNNGAVTCSGETHNIKEIGGIAGKNYSGTVTNCTNTGTVKGGVGDDDRDVGGIVGINESGTIEYCTNSGSVDGIEVIGGIVGYNQLGTIKFCYNYSDIAIAGGKQVGGIVGNLYSGTASYCTNSGNISGIQQIGGIYGYAIDENSATNCTNTGTIIDN